ncbi:DUF4382 domain-containing protein, partial [candidate division KSB1 bacterium]|nr:DUF4382 domain-containing protein [candidate division KSB1 bacterium]
DSPSGDFFAIGTSRQLHPVCHSLRRRPAWRDCTALETSVFRGRPCGRHPSPDGEYPTVDDGVRGADITVNLLDFSNGRSVVIGSADVPAGMYTQIRIKIDTAWVVVGGFGHDLDVPSGAQTGLKLGPPFTINEGSTVELMLDFDANRSIVTTGPPTYPRTYKLKPRIRLISTALTGSISGTADPTHLPVAFAIAGADTITSTLADKVSGGFMLAFLPEGVYTVSARDTMNKSFEINDVQVVAGSDNYIGDVTLQ